jgi:hypothetical protein
MFAVLMDPSWLSLEEGETRPRVLESLPDRCVVFSVQLREPLGQRSLVDANARRGAG